MKVLLVIPCYKCEKQIPRVISSIACNPELLSLLDEILVLDNRSPDGTLIAAQQSIRNLPKKFKVALNDQNYGLGGSHKAGLDYALKNNYDYMAILHGDDQGSASDLVKLIHAAKVMPKASGILGARFMPGSKLQGYSLLRIMGNLIFNFLYSITTRRCIWDLGSGVNLFKLSDLDSTIIRGFSDHFSFNYDLTLYYAQTHRNVVYQPITWKETDQVSNVRNYLIGKKALELLWKYFRSGELTYEETYQRYSFTLQP